MTSAAPLFRSLLEALDEVPAGKGGAKQHQRPRCCPDICLRDIETAAGGGEGLLQLLNEKLPVLPGRFLKIQHHTGISSPSALPQNSGGELFRFPDHRGLPVADGQQAALRLKQQILPQQGGVLTDPIGHMGKGTSVLGCLPQLTGRYG